MPQYPPLLPKQQLNFSQIRAKFDGSTICAQLNEKVEEESAYGYGLDMDNDKEEEERTQTQMDGSKRVETSSKVVAARG